MNIPSLHSWDLSPPEAVALQRFLAGKIDTRRRLTRCRIVAGADVSHDLDSDIFYAGVVVLKCPEMEVMERQAAVRESTFPYRSGLLSFREAPSVLEAFSKVESRIDAVVLDGHGFAHPRRCGFASHVGLWLNLPTVGCAKTRLTGKFRVPAADRGAAEPLMLGEETIGSVVRSKKGVKPVFVSVGHRIDLASAVRLVLETCQGYRIPEPTRQAHLFVNALRRGEVAM